MEAKTILFNRAAKLNGWKVATQDQVELKLKQLARNAAKSSPSRSRLRRTVRSVTNRNLARNGH